MTLIIALLFWLEKSQIVVEEVFDTLIASTQITELEIESLRASAPKNLTTETATEHIIAAQVAANRYQVDRSLLLAIGHHESRYDHRAVTLERGGKVSCGVMTPIPTYDRALCKTMTQSLRAGYQAGAEHLRGWLDACRGNQRRALLGFAGGFRMIRACALGPVLRTTGRHDDLCLTPQVFEFRARLIRSRSARRE
jgi:hypothetical protein